MLREWNKGEANLDTIQINNKKDKTRFFQKRGKSGFQVFKLTKFNWDQVNKACKAKSPCFLEGLAQSLFATWFWYTRFCSVVYNSLH